MNYTISLKQAARKEIYKLGEDFSGKSQQGEQIGFTNYYMERNGEPFFGISGEFHFSRCDESRWEDELIKMKMGGINVVSTYVFWIHHEEEEGVFDFEGNKNLGEFVRLCKEAGLYVILRIGPFDHGEVRNGGLPDWLYGKPFEVRSVNEGFMYYVRRLYAQIASQVSGMFFKQDGPIIAVQLDNEYMHSSAPWELTTGISNEWVPSGSEGCDYMFALRKLAEESGLIPPFYTCTGWGGAAAPKNMMPLWGGYAFRPWLFYSGTGTHPSTEEYIYQDFHNNNIRAVNDFVPDYLPEERPYACCEMGGGMFCSYNYRFLLPYKSVDAMANIKLASGCNFLGYYMYHGGSNPVGKHGTFLNECQTPKISYDFQAPIGEFGKIRESYKRLKTIHLFAKTFEKELCPLATVLPEGASDISPKDLKTLRFAVRTDGRRGFLFLNNYQDHEVMAEKNNEAVTLLLEKETITIPGISIAPDENCILPFHMDLDGTDLVYATAQPVTVLQEGGRKTYLFMRPEGMTARFLFEEDVEVAGTKERSICMDDAEEVKCFLVRKDQKEVTILCISRALANEMYLLEGKGLVFTKAALLVKKGAVRIETRQECNPLLCYPSSLLQASPAAVRKDGGANVLGRYEVLCPKKDIAAEYEKVAENRYVVRLPEGCMEGIKDLVLRIRYVGDIGHAFIDGALVHDNFYNGDVWEFALRRYREQLEKSPLTVYITPQKEGGHVNVESGMAARTEEVLSSKGELQSVTAAPVYERAIM